MSQPAHRPADARGWEIRPGNGPIVATAIHDGHDLRSELLPWLALSPDERRREEDPLTGYWTCVGDSSIRVFRSRFEMDLNRPRELAVPLTPERTWGLRVWKEAPPAPVIERSLAQHDAFYAQVERLITALIDRWGTAVVLDLHSYNHRREGPDAAPADPARNPDIDLGLTTLDRTRWGRVVDAFSDAMCSTTLHGRPLDVRANVRYPGGGHFPTWLHHRFGDRVCAISLEYKKIFMDEWTCCADLAAVEELRTGLEQAVAALRARLGACG